jgi:hypothetical protein
MNQKLLWGLAICLASPLFVGCATTPGVVRAQSPANGPLVSSDASVQGYPANGAPVAGDAACPQGCPPNGCNDGACAPGCLPHHEFFYHYVGPEKGCCLEGSCLAGCCLLRNGCCCLQPCCAALPDWITNRGPLVYPQNPSPGALIQYPYYVCKGPDDFFYPPIGPRL